MFVEKPMKTEITTWSEFPNGEKAIEEQILAPEEINPKEQDCEIHNQGFEIEDIVDIQATIECGFTLKRIRDMTRTYSQMS